MPGRSPCVCPVIPHHTPFELRGGPGARRHVAEHGLSPADIACIPAAAGGPKGLALLPLDRLLCAEWLPRNPGIELVGASVGAWRMAALAQRDPLAALDRVQHAYVHGQCYAAKPTPADVSTACAAASRAPPAAPRCTGLRRGVSLSIVTSRARGRLHDRESKLAFGTGCGGQRGVAQTPGGYLERVVFQAGAPPVLLREPGFDRVRPGDACRSIPDNAEDALLASGTIPLLATPVRNIAGAPPGNYWDGALVDYHLLLPYSRLTREDAGERTNRPLSALQRLRDTRLARQAPAVATRPARARLARRRAARRSDSGVPGDAAERQVAGPAGLLSLRADHAGANPRLGNSHRRVRPLCRGRHALARTAGPHADQANLKRAA